METIAKNIESLGTINPILPFIVSMALFVVVLIVAFVPISFFLWLISASFGGFINLLVNKSQKIANYFFLQAKKNTARANRLFKNYYKQYQSLINFDQPSYRISGHPAQEAIDNFSRSLDEVPSLLTESEKNKSTLIADLNSNLEDLSKGSLSLQNIDIPELELDKTVALNKRSAGWQILIFTPFAPSLIAD